MNNLKQLNKKYCGFVAFSLALALVAPFMSCGGDEGGGPSATPESFKATPLDGEVRLTWNSQAGVTYELFFSTSTGFTPDDATGSFPNVTSPYTHDDLTNETTYYYLLRGNNPSGMSGTTPEVSATPAPPPKTPQNLMAVPLDGEVRLTWNSQAGVTYELFFSTSTGFTPDDATGSFPNVTSPYTHDDLTNGSTYYYLLRGSNPSGMSGTTPEVSSTPAPPPEMPESFNAHGSTRQVTLTWNSQASVTYELLFSTSTGFTVSNPEGSLPGVSSPHTHKGLANDTTYYYLLRASNPAGTSMPTPEVSAKTFFVKPENFTAVASNEQVTLTWVAQPDLTYQLFRSTDRNFPMGEGTEEISNDAMPPYPHTNLTNGIRYYYRLVANRNSPSDMMNMSAPAEGAATPYTAQADPAGRLSAGRYHTCALMDEGMNSDRRVKCWGDLREGQLGNGLRGIAFRPIYAGNLTASVTQVSAGETHTCAVVGDGALCWGVGENGQLGDGMKRRRTTPVRVDKLSTGVTQISAGGSHTCAVVSRGALCWGKNNRGQLGNGSNIRRATPQQVMGLTEDVTQISAGTWHTCALEGNGGAFCWGEGADGQLGDGREERYVENDRVSHNRWNTPQQVMGLTEGVTQISAGGSHTCAVVNGGALCWGRNDFGQLGSGDNTNKLVPHQVTGLTVSGLTLGALTSGVTKISAGAAHTCAVVYDHALCWGRGRFEQLGTGGTSDANIPQQVMGLTEGVAEISAGAEHTCALAGGRFGCWGLASDGRLGNNERGGGGAVPVPVQN